MSVYCAVRELTCFAYILVTNSLLHINSNPAEIAGNEMFILAEFKYTSQGIIENNLLLAGEDGGRTAMAKPLSASLHGS